MVKGRNVGLWGYIKTSVKPISVIRIVDKEWFTKDIAVKYAEA